MCCNFCTQEKSLHITLVCCDCKISWSDVNSVYWDFSYTDIRFGNISIPFLSLHLLDFQCLHHRVEGGSQGTDCSNCYTSCISRFKYYLTPSTESVNLFSGGVKRMAGHSLCTCLGVKSFIIYEIIYET